MRAVKKRWYRHGGIYQKNETLNVNNFSTFYAIETVDHSLEAEYDGLMNIGTKNWQHGSAIELLFKKYPKKGSKNQLLTLIVNNFHNLLFSIILIYTYFEERLIMVQIEETVLNMD